MNKTLLLSVLFLLTLSLLTLSLFGCAVQQQSYEQPEQEVQQIAEPEEELEEQEAQEEPEAQPEPEEEQAQEEGQEEGQEEEVADEYNLESLPRDVQIKVKLVRELMEEARNREENYFFRYTSPDILQTDVWVKGDVLKRTIHRYDELDKYTTYNMVYLYRDTKKAEGYCETTKSKCFEGHGPFKESYTDNVIKTPKDWLLELDDNFVWALDNKISDQLYHIVDYHRDGNIIRVFVNDYRGWPAKIEIYEDESQSLDSIPSGKPDKTYLYDDMDIGGVSEDDVTPG